LAFWAAASFVVVAGERACIATAIEAASVGTSIIALGITVKLAATIASKGNQLD